MVLSVKAKHIGQIRTRCSYTYGVICCISPHVEIFEELRGTSILTSDLLPHLRSYRPE